MPLSAQKLSQTPPPPPKGPHSSVTCWGRSAGSSLRGSEAVQCLAGCPGVARGCHHAEQPSMGLTVLGASRAWRGKAQGEALGWRQLCLAIDGDSHAQSCRVSCSLIAFPY